MSDHLTVADVTGPAITGTGGALAATASLTLVQQIGLIASIIGAIWGLISIIKALYFFIVWINKTAIPYLKARKSPPKKV